MNRLFSKKSEFIPEISKSLDAAKLNNDTKSSVENPLLKGLFQIKEEKFDPNPQRLSGRSNSNYFSKMLASDNESDVESVEEDPNHNMIDYAAFDEDKVGNEQEDDAKDSEEEIVNMVPFLDNYDEIVPFVDYMDVKINRIN